MDTILLGVLTSVGANYITVILDKIKSGFFDDDWANKLSRQVDKAFSKEPLPDIDSGFVSFSLRKWLNSDDFQRILKSIREGHLDVLSDDCVIESYKANGGWSEDADHDMLKEIIRHVIAELKSLVFDGEGGGAATASLIQNEGKVIREEIKTIQIQMQATISEKDRVVMSSLSTADHLLANHNAKAALEVLEKCESDVKKDGVSKESLFQYHVKCGQACVRIQHLDDAIRAFVKAIQADSDNKDGDKIKALVAVLEDSPDAFELAGKALKESKYRDSQAANIYLMACKEANHFVDANDFVSENHWVLENDVCRFNYAQMLSGQGRVDEAIVHFRAVTSKDLKDPLYLFVLGLALIQKAYPKSIENKNQELEADAVSALTESLDLFSDVVNSECADGRHLYSIALYHRATAKVLLKRYSEAIVDYEMLLGIEPDNINAKHGLGLCAAKSGDYSRAITLLEPFTLGSKTLYNESIFPLAQAYAAMGDHVRVIELLKPCFDSRNWIEAPLNIAYMLLVAASTTNDLELSSRLVAEFCLLSSDQIEQKCFQGLYHFYRKEHKEAMEMLSAVYEVVDRKREIEQFRSLYAELLFTQGDWSTASEQLSYIVTASEDSECTRMYLYSLYMDDRLEELMKFMERMTAEGRTHMFALEIKMNLSQRLGFWDTVRSTAAELKELDPAQLRWSLHWIEALYNVGRIEEASEAAGELSIENCQEIPDYVMSANILERVEAGMGIEYLYVALRKFPNSAELRMAFLQSFFKLDRMGLFKDANDRVRQESVVTIVGSDKIIEVAFLVAGVSEASDLRIDSDHDLYQALMGRSVGDEIEWRSEFDGVKEWKILKIENRYGRVISETFSSFGLMFPKSDLLRRKKIDHGEENPFREMAQELHENQEYKAQFIEEYRQMKLPLFALARVFGVDVYTLWNGIVNDPDVGLVASSCTENERSSESALLSETSVIVLDETALYTLERIEMLNEVSGSFRQILVAPALKSKLRRKLKDEYAEYVEKNSVRSYAGVLIPWKLELEQWEREKKTLKSVLSWLEGKAEDLPTDVLQENAPLVEQAHLLGSEDSVFSYDQVLCALAARKYQGVFCSDDYVTRTWLSGGVMVNVAGVESILRELLRKKVIDAKRYQDALIELCMLEYHHVGFDERTIWRAWERDRFVVGRYVTAVVEKLSRPDVDIKSVIAIAVRTIRVLCSEAVIDVGRNAVVDLIMATLLRCGERDYVLNAFPRALEFHMRLLHAQYKEMLGRWIMWVNM